MSGAVRRAKQWTGAAMRPGSRQEGFTYVALLVAMTLVALATTGVMEVVSTQALREREAALLRVGNVYAGAIGSFYNASPGSRKSYPRTLDELTDDPRLVTIKRHLRETYVDPISGNSRWGLIRTPEGTIAGVYSLSERTPIRSSAIDLEFVRLPPAIRYSDWKFTYTPEASATSLKR